VLRETVLDRTISVQLEGTDEALARLLSGYRAALFELAAEIDNLHHELRQ
jgi:hypothetical protein